MKKVLVTFLVTAVAALLLYVVIMLPPMGDPNNPTNVNIAPRYLEHGPYEAGTRNVVTGVVLNYRGYDTLGEVTLLFSTSLAVLSVLGKNKKKIGHSYVDMSSIKFSFIIRTAVIISMPFIVLFSLYTVVFGTELPGGGFQAGAIFGVSIVVFTFVFGLLKASDSIPDRFRTSLEGTAIVAFVFVGTVGFIGGANFLTYAVPHLPLEIQPVIRTLMLVTIQFGIGIDVCMIVASILFALLREEEHDDMDYVHKQY